jgi:hypothetical protein
VLDHTVFRHRIIHARRQLHEKVTAFAAAGTGGKIVGSGIGYHELCTMHTGGRAAMTCFRSNPSHGKIALAKTENAPISIHVRCQVRCTVEIVI